MTDLLSVAPFPSAFLADGDFLRALWRSPTFLDLNGLFRLTAPVVVCIAGGVLGCAFAKKIGRRRRRAASLHRDQSGSATMIDFVLVTPVFVYFMFLVFQYAILAKNHLFTHYAAYQAARSARVYLCPQFNLSLGEAADEAAGIRVCNDEQAQAKAEFAARIAMIPAAPYRRLRCYTDCSDAPYDMIRSLANSNGLKKRTRALREQARYMFDDDNVKVTIGRAQSAYYTAGISSPQTPVTAKVEARILLLDQTGWIFASGRRRDGHYWVLSRAEVSLL